MLQTSPHIHTYTHTHTSTHKPYIIHTRRFLDLLDFNCMVTREEYDIFTANLYRCRHLLDVDVNMLTQPLDPRDHLSTSSSRQHSFSGTVSPSFSTSSLSRGASPQGSFRLARRNSADTPNWGRASIDSPTTNLRAISMDFAGKSRRSSVALCSGSGDAQTPQESASNSGRASFIFRRQSLPTSQSRS